MLPTTKQIAWQIAVMHEKYPKLTISDIAASLMLSPIFVINALEEGEEGGIIKRLRDKKGELTDELAVMPKINYERLEAESLGAEHLRIHREIYRLIKSANADENDIEEGTLNYWTRGIKPSEIELAIHILTETKILSSYTLTDPADKKSKYTFYTLSANEGKQWGTKQFKAKKAKK